MTDDARVYALVRAAAPPKYRVREELEACAVTGRKHSYKIVTGGPGTKKDDIGLILSVCPNTRSTRCARHLKPIKLQMTLDTRLGLLLDLAALHPPPFQSEEFARWCCQATMALLARDAVVLRGCPLPPPGLFTAFTASMPGFEDLPRLGEAVDASRLPVRTQAYPLVLAADGEEVDVLLVIYEIDRIGPYRVVAKGKKLGALVGFTFRQPAVIRALGLAPNSRELSSYLMYEPFQQAWTKAVQPCQTVTVCEGGGAIYRHPRVNVTLWLDLYVKHIYPDWVRQGLALHDLAAIAAENDGAPQPLTQAAPREVATGSGFAAVRTQRPLLALPGPKQSDKPKRPLLALRVPGPAVKATRQRLTLPTNSVTSKRIPLALPAPSVEKTGDMPVPPAANTAAATTSVGGGHSVGTSNVIDLTVDTDSVKTRKRKRSLVGPEPVVELSLVLEEKASCRRRQRRLRTAMKLEGKGTKREPYIL